MTLYNKQGVAFEVEGIYCKHCASPNASPEASDNENEAAIATLATKPEGVLEGAPVQVYAEAAVQHLHKHLYKCLCKHLCKRLCKRHKQRSRFL